MPVFGWPKHGRSAYLTALVSLLTRLSLVWPEYSYREATGVTRRFLSEANEHVLCGSLPSWANKGEQNLLLMLEGMPRWGSLGLAFGDWPGADFKQLELCSELSELIRWSPFALMVISPADLYDHGNWGTVDMLFNSYLDSLGDIPADPVANPRGLVVVLTKGDLLQTQVPDGILDYVSNDVLSSRLKPRRSNLAKEMRLPSNIYSDQEVRDYLVTMRDHEKALSAWLSADPHFRSLQVKARRHQIELRFSMVSALGEPAREDGTLPVSWSPKRVLDPFFWLLELERELGGSENFLNRWQVTDSDRNYYLRVTQYDQDGKEIRVLQARMTSSSGTLANIDAGLAHVSFELRAGGVYFGFLRRAPVSVYRNGGWGAVLSSYELIHAGEVCRIDDWQIEVKSVQAAAQSPEETLIEG